MNSKTKILLTAVAVLALQLSISAAPATFPLKVSGNRRHLVDQRGVPFFVNGEAGWRVLFAISLDELRAYLDDRKAKGINTILCQFVPDAYGEGDARRLLAGDQPDFEGQHAFIDRDVSKPNEPYWKRIDRMLAECTQRGFVLFVSTHYLGCCRDGWTEILEAPPNTDEKCREFGRWIGRRYKDVPNIVWVGGGDHNETRRSILMCEGIAETDPNHIHTYHTASDYSARDRIPDAKWLSLNMTYNYYPAMQGRERHHVYFANYQAWSAQPAMPFVMGESAYEMERDAPAQFIRRQAWWSYLGGACGHIYGHRATYSHPKGWLERLNDPGARAMGVLNGAFLGRPWHLLEPDWGHNVVIAGRGFFNAGSTPGGEDYATAARSSDGKLVMVYMPSARSITVQMSRLAAPTVGQWFDPTSGDVVRIDEDLLPNQGNRDFVPPGKNKGGDSDWVLILETDPPQR